MEEFVGEVICLQHNILECSSGYETDLKIMKPNRDGIFILQRWKHELEQLE